MLWQISIKTIRQGQYMGNNKEIQRQQYNRTVTMLKQYRDAQFFYTTHNRRREQTADRGSSTAYYGSTRRDTAAQAAGRERGRVYSVAHVLHAGLYIRADRERIEYRERYTKTLDYGSGKRAGSYGLWD